MNRKWLRRLCLYGSAGCLALVWALAGQSLPRAAWAQSTPGQAPALPPAATVPVTQPAAPAPPQTGAADETEQPFKIVAPVFNVTTPVTVFDSGGNLVYDLSEEEFNIYDNGEPQKIVGFSNEMRTLSLVIVVETNDTTVPFLDSVRPLSSMFSQLVMGPQGEVSVLTYSDHVDRVLDFTQDGDKLDTVLRSLHGRGSGMHLDDAIIMALSMLRSRPIENRKVAIVFSDGFNIGSKMSRGEIVKGAMNSNITIYGLGFSPAKALLKRPVQDPKPDLVNESVARSMPPGVAPTPTAADNVWGPNDVPIVSILLGLGEEAKKPLFKDSMIYFARYSGGQSYQKWGKDTVQQTLNQIATEIHSQYELAYNPRAELKASESLTPGYHTIKVEVRRPGAKVRARAGWFYQGEVPRGVPVK